ncbi:MAG: hypothetical protein LBE18_11010 [Planctomycetaceae bacterium]|jgi:hypothetical protein|nr:hypothetical protein [Planctomycetaceae bacterium]
MAVHEITILAKRIKCVSAIEAEVQKNIRKIKEGFYDSYMKNAAMRNSKMKKFDNIPITL